MPEPKKRISRKEKKTFYVTTPIYYVNDVPHIGHAYTTIAADTLARWHRLAGQEVFFLTGTDEHGQKVERAAKAKGKKPQTFVNSVVKRFQETWKLLNISNDGFIRTTDKSHIAAVQQFIKKIKKNIYNGTYKGPYCVPCESYWTPSQVVKGKCPQCGREVEEIEEEGYFFRLSKYQKQLLKLYKSRPEFISPSRRREEIIKRVKEGLKDIYISRTTFKWGVPFPSSKKHVIWVWIDALLNYISALGWPAGKFKKFWPADTHLIGKEILWFHAVIWPAMLLAAGLPLPRQVFAHGWMTVEGEKMSKSKGNFIPPKQLTDKYGVDTLRYFLLRAIAFGQDGDFSEDALRLRYNTELADKLGNLLSRTLSLIEKNLKGSLPRGRVDDMLVNQLPLDGIKGHMDKLELDRALALIFSYVDACNVYLQEKKPWALPWRVPPKDHKELVNILYTVADSLRIIAALLSPFMPQTAQKICTQLGTKLGTIADCKPGLLKTTKIKKGPVLFKKLD